MDLVEPFLAPVISPTTSEAQARPRLVAGALDGLPGPFSNIADQRDLCRRPRARGRVVGTEGGHQVTVLQQHDADKRLDLSRFQGDPFGFREPGIGIDVADDNGLAALEHGAQRRCKLPRPFLSGKRRDTANVFTPNDVLAVFDFRVADTWFTPGCSPSSRAATSLHVERMAQRTQRIGESGGGRFPVLRGSCAR